MTITSNPLGCNLNDFYTGTIGRAEVNFTDFDPLNAIILTIHRKNMRNNYLGAK